MKKQNKTVLTEQEIKAIKAHNRQYNWIVFQERAKVPVLALASILAACGGACIVGGIINIVLTLIG